MPILSALSCFFSFKSGLFVLECLPTWLIGGNLIEAIHNQQSLADRVIVLLFFSIICLPDLVS